jgi:hypothetical protein
MPTFTVMYLRVCLRVYLACGSVYEFIHRSVYGSVCRNVFDNFMVLSDKSVFPQRGYHRSSPLSHGYSNFFFPSTNRLTYQNRNIYPSPADGRSINVVAKTVKYRHSLCRSRRYDVLVSYHFSRYQWKSLCLPLLLRSVPTWPVQIVTSTYGSI